MHDGVIRTEKRAERKVEPLTKANDCIERAKLLGPPAMLFDSFWSEGELAMLFGPAGVGKSILAVQIADAIARGRKMEGFVMPTKGQRVLYVDLKLSDRQFGLRYFTGPETGEELRTYKCSENLHRMCAPDTNKFCDWLEETVVAKRVRVVIIDDLSELRNSCDGTRETLKLMRDLRKLKLRLDISILVIAGCREAGRSGFIAESDLQRSRVLCDAADSVFALGVLPRNHAHRYLVQTRSRGSRIAWTASNSPICDVFRFDDGLLGFRFDERFAPEIDRELGLLICKVKSMHDRGATYRKIGEDLGINHTKAARLFKKWTPELGAAIGFEHPQESPPADVVAFTEPVKHDFPTESYDGEFTDNYLASIGIQRDRPAKAVAEGATSPLGRASESDHQDAVEEGNPKELEERRGHRIYIPSPDQVTIDHTINPMSSLKRSFDNNGREIFIEKENSHGKPVIFYRYGSQNRLSRFERDGIGSSGRPVDGPISLFNTS